VSRHHADPRYFDPVLISAWGMSTYMPWLATRAVNRMSLGQSRPPLAAPKRMVRSGYSRGRACRVTSRNAIGTRCLIRHWQECVEVNANKLLYGNERETSSIRSPGFRPPGGWPFLGSRAPGGCPGPRAPQRADVPHRSLRSQRAILERAGRPDQGPTSRAHRAEGPVRITQPHTEPNSCDKRLSGDE